MSLRLRFATRILAMGRAIANPNTDPNVPVSDGGQLCLSLGPDGVIWVRQAVGKNNGVPSVVPGGVPGTIFQTHNPGIGVRASTVFAAPALNQKYVCAAISASLGDTVAAAEATGILVLRDGASGAGTIIWQQNLAPLLAGDSKQINITGLQLFGSANTAMTLEFVNAPAGTGFQSVSAAVYQVL